MSFFEISDSSNVKVHGNLDAETVTQNWWKMLTQQQRESILASKHCRFDLSDVQRADSAGLAWLVNAVRDARKAGIQVDMVALPDKLLNLARISDVDTLLPVIHSSS